VSGYVLSLMLVLGAWVALWWVDSGPGSERFHLPMRHVGVRRPARSHVASVEATWFEEDDPRERTDPVWR
jgi:hypothetical protein